MKRPNRSVFAAAVLALSAALCACSGPAPVIDQTATLTPAPAAQSQSPAESPSADPTTAAPSTPVPLATAASSVWTTFSGSLEDVEFSFDYPADWNVVDFSEILVDGNQVTVSSADGTNMATLMILSAWGPECNGPTDCVDRPAVYLGDWAGETPLSASGPFVVRSVAMDLAGFPQDRSRSSWDENVQMVTSLSWVTTPPPESLLPNLMYGVGRVETGIEGANRDTKRTVLFTGSKGFGTLQEAQAYTATDEHRKVQAMIASFRERR